MRVVLCVAALVAVRPNPAPRAFYWPLGAAGKPRKLALTAAMGNLLVILTALITDAVKNLRD